MTDYLAALAGAGTVVGVAVTIAARTVRPTGRHRAPAPQPRQLTASKEGS